MTTNLGTDLMRKGGLGFGEQQATADYETIKTRMLDEIKRLFKPEFLNRVDEIVVFRPLTREDVTRILELEVAQVKQRVAAKGLTLLLTPEARDFLIEKGYDPALGARPMRRAVQRHLEDPLAEEILRGEWSGTDRVEVVRGPSGLSFRAAVPAP